MLALLPTPGRVVHDGGLQLTELRFFSAPFGPVLRNLAPEVSVRANMPAGELCFPAATPAAFPHCQVQGPSEVALRTSCPRVLPHSTPGQSLTHKEGGDSGC